MRIYNTQTRQKEDFVPLEPGKVKIYVCGPTVYNYFHLGNARPFITYDTLRRYFEYRGYVVTYVQNFTDIDDKMITRANQEGISTDELAQRFIDAYYQDADQLNIRRADHHPRATRTIPMIIELVQLLVDRGYAYTASDGVYFDVARYANYGKLSHHRLEDLLAGASDRLTDLSDKKSSADFALWKFKKKANRPGRARGVKDVPAGILSARLWSASIWVIPLTFMAAGRTWSFPIMKTKSPRAKPRPASLSSDTGCTTASLILITRKCPNRAAISLR